MTHPMGIGGGTGKRAWCGREGQGEELREEEELSSSEYS